MIIREMLPRELDVVLNLFNYYCEAADIGHRMDRLNDVYDELGFSPTRISIMNKEIA